ncbi:MAG TPA: acyl-CoA dehydrogenase family protein [Myxococcaceae bacterium]|nr:acyl-CoA dehydrogenase family protein [Myxococcaceae bacterium]
MDFSTPPRVAELLPAIRAFVNERIQPLERRMSEGWSALEPELERVRAEVKRRGWWAPHFHSEHGGMGLSLMEFAYDLFPIKPIIGRNTLSQNESKLPLSYCHRYCGPYY